MELDKLHYFMKVAQCEHMTQAANDLHMTQPALSRIISQLEGELGVKLFDRKGRTLQLNDNGRIVYESAERIFDEMLTMRERLSDLTDGTRGSVTFLTSYPIRENDWVTSAIKTYVRSHSEVEFYQIQKDVGSIREELESRRADVALSDRPIISGTIDFREIYTERLGVIMARDHILASHPVIGLGELEHESFFSNDDRSHGGDITTYVCERAGFTPNVIFRGDYPMLIGEAIGKKRGISIMSEGAYLQGFSKESDISWNPDITFRPIREEYCRRTFGIATLKGRYLPKVVQEFHDLLVNFDVESYRKKQWERVK